MPLRNACITAIVLLCIGTFVWTFAYGPAKRTFVIPDRTVHVRSVSDIDGIWNASGVHGRIAVIFARRLNQPVSITVLPEGDYLDGAMNHGIVRTAYYIVPDRVWADVLADNLQNPSLIIQPKIIDAGYILLHEAGRIYFEPFSKYIPEQDREKALVVIEPAVWTREEQARISGYIRSGQLPSDLTVIVGEGE
jgi:hypothetical protein